MHSTPVTYLEHLITLLLPTVTLNFLLWHTLPKTLTTLHNFSSESAISAVSSAKYRLVYLKPAAIRTHQFQHFPKHPEFTSCNTPSTYTLNNHGDLTTLSQSKMTSFYRKEQQQSKKNGQKWEPSKLHTKLSS